jgi:hypothetical protein
MNKQWIYFLVILIALITMAPGTQPPKTPPATEPVKTQPVETEPVQTEPVKTQPVETLPVVTEDITAVPERTSTPHREQKDKFANASLPKSGYGPNQPVRDPNAAIFGVIGTAVLLIFGVLALTAALWNRR